MYEDTLLEKLNKINEIKKDILITLQDIGCDSITEDTKFEDYASKIREIFSNTSLLSKTLRFIYEGGSLEEIISGDDDITQIAQYLQNILIQKSNLATNLNALGKYVKSTDSLELLVSCVYNGSKELEENNQRLLTQNAILEDKVKVLEAEIESLKSNIQEL